MKELMKEVKEVLEDPRTKVFWRPPDKDLLAQRHAHPKGPQPLRRFEVDTILENKDQIEEITKLAHRTFIIKVSTPQFSFSYIVIG